MPPDIEIIMESQTFEWDLFKEESNLEKHGIDFRNASEAFFDSSRIILKDSLHSAEEQRFFCLGKVDSKVLTVRFVRRGKKIRIFGAAKWRKWEKFYNGHQKEKD